MHLLGPSQGNLAKFPGVFYFQSSISLQNISEPPNVAVFFPNDCCHLNKCIHCQLIICH